MPAMYFIVFKEVLDLFENPVVVVTDQKEPFLKYFSKNKPVSSTSANFLSCKIDLL